jgi:hypothetical protein
VTVPNRSADRVPRAGSWRTRLRRSRAVAPAQEAPRSDHGLWTVDRALRALATACRHADRGVPEAYAVVVGPDAVVLHLGTPDERPPAGWTAEQDGRIWRASLRWLQSANVADLPREPYPRLVSLGTGAAGFVLLNLGLAGGIVCLEGDARQAGALARDWARELGTGPWSRGVRVVRIGFPPDAPETGAAAGTVTDARTLADAEGALADEAGGVLLLAAPPGGRDRERVRQLVGDPEQRWSVVVVGRAEQPRWRFALDAAGVVDTGLLDGPVGRHSVPAGAPAAPAKTGAEPVAAADRPRSPVFTRWRIVIAAVVAACVAGAVIGLASAGGSHPDAPAAQTAKTRAGAPAASTAPAAIAPSSAAATAANAPGAALVNPASGKCLSGSAGSDGTPLILFACNGDANQAWRVAADGTIRTKGLCMDAAWGATAPGTVVQIANCSGNPAQQFALRNGTIYTSHANLCVAVANGGAVIHLSPCDGKAAEVFRRS